LWVDAVELTTAIRGPSLTSNEGPRRKIAIARRESKRSVL
jgi:hypothetical protein